MRLEKSSPATLCFWALSFCDDFFCLDDVMNLYGVLSTAKESRAEPRPLSLSPIISEKL